MPNFYRSGDSYYTADTNTKVADVNALQGLAKAGGKEIAAPTAPTGSQAIASPSDIPNYNVTANIGGSLYGTPKNVVDSSTLSAGINGANVSSKLPTSSDAAAGLYADRSLTDATSQQSDLQKQLDQFKAQRIKDTQTQLDTAQNAETTQIANYDATNKPLVDKATGIYNSMLDSISGTNYGDLVKQKLDLTNQIVNYSKMMQDELNTQAQQPSLDSVATGRVNAIKENYTSKIAIAQAAQTAIDGDFNLAFDIMDKGAKAIENLTTDRINFINTVKGLYDSKILSLTTTEKELLDQASTDAQTKIDNLQKNKDSIMSLMQTNPIIASKAGLSLTDTPEVSTKKLNDFYVKNPQYTPQNQTWIKEAMDKYLDAGITLNDTLATVQSKLQKSQSFKSDLMKNNTDAYIKLKQAGLILDEKGNIVTDNSNATVDQIADAIKKVESNGNYSAKGGSGESGAYQFMPGTWASWSSDYASQVLKKSVSSLPMTPENQDAVAKWKIQSWYNKGYTAEQIAAAWNAGEGSVANDAWKSKIGTNSKGVFYNTPGYVSKVMNALGSTTANSATTSITNDVQSVLEGRNTLYNIRQTMGRTNQAAAYMQKMRDEITKIDPNFDFVASDAGGKAVSTSYFQRSIAAIDTVMPNIDKIVELSNQVSRVGVAGVDSILQKGAVQIGNQKVANFRQAQKLISDEIGIALGAGTVSDMKLQLGFDVTDPSVSPEVFASNMGIVKDFINNRKKGLEDLRYQSSTTQNGVKNGTSTTPVDISHINFKMN
jgi:hypothetical protein